MNIKLNQPLEHPLVTRLCRYGVIDDRRINSYCYFCDCNIYEGDTYFQLDMLDICDRYDCRQEAFMKNADRMLIDFVLDEQILSDGIEWFFENYANKIN